MIAKHQSIPHEEEQRPSDEQENASEVDLHQLLHLGAPLVELVEFWWVVEEEIKQRRDAIYPFSVGCPASREQAVN